MKCEICGKGDAAEALRVCRNCILEGKGYEYIQKAHKILPNRGKACNMCGNDCRMEERQKGFCRLRENREEKILSYSDRKTAIGQYYYDSLPTNCVASWVCGLEKGYNLAVFYGACNFDCLFCQNWIHHEMAEKRQPVITADEVIKAAENAKCVCFFGGDPSCQILHALNVAEHVEAIVCWETNGNFAKRYLPEVAKHTDGIVKFDLKTWNEKLSYALCGVSNKNSYENFEYLAKHCRMAASTLLVPYYINAEEVYDIASFIASIDDNIPYTLLAFYPCYKMSDLPYTSKKQAMECYDAAKKAGLKKVRIGNIHLLR